MDPKPQMPDIKADVNKVDDGKKKSTGLLGLLTGGGGSGAAGGLGGLGAGSAGAGGLLATKAGMLALVLMGSAVAGGIGLAGYKMFGPGESDKAGGNLSLFAPRTQTAVDPNAVAPVNADGSSASLNFASAAAAKDKAAEDAAAAAAAAASASAAAPTDNTAGDPAKDAADAARRQAEARASSGGALNSGGGSGAAGTMNLSNVKKLGALSGASSGGATTSASASSKLGDSMASAARNGPSSAFSRQNGGAAKASASSGRGVNRRNQTARQQAIGVRGDQRGAPTSFAAGRTYDGSGATGSGASGPEGGGIGMGGAGDGAGAQPKSLAANSANQKNEQEPPPAEPPAKDVTPWAKQIMMGMAAGAIAAALLMWAASMMKEAKTLYGTESIAAAPLLGPAVAAAHFITTMTMVRVIIGAAILAGLAGVMLGGMISGGANGQTLQGGLLIASSLAITAAAAGMMHATWQPLPDPKGDVAEPAKIAAFKDPAAWMYIVGGLGAVGLVGTMLAPKKTCKSDQDGCHAYIQQQPSPTNYTV